MWLPQTSPPRSAFDLAWLPRCIHGQQLLSAPPSPSIQHLLHQTTPNPLQSPTELPLQAAHGGRVAMSNIRHLLTVGGEASTTKLDHYIRHYRDNTISDTRRQRSATATLSALITRLRLKRRELPLHPGPGGDALRRRHLAAPSDTMVSSKLIPRRSSSSSIHLAQEVEGRHQDSMSP